MGIVALGRVLQSSNGICGEIGHLAIANTKSSRGPQTLMRATSGNIIVKQCEAEAWARDLPRSDGGKLALADICWAAKRGHGGANELLCEHARIVGAALASVVSLIGCETIVIGGVWQDSGDEVRSCFESEIRNHIAGAIAERIHVRYANHRTERTAFAAAWHGARQVWARLS
jgi:predicted NBD/HSP70 family sugar kinase